MALAQPKFAFCACYLGRGPRLTGIVAYQTQRRAAASGCGQPDICPKRAHADFLARAQHAGVAILPPGLQRGLQLSSHCRTDVAVNAAYAGFIVAQPPAQVLGLLRSDR